MKKKILSTLLILALILLVDYIFYYINFKYSVRQRISIINFLILSLLFFFLFVNLIYNSWFTLKSKKWIVILWIVMPLVLAMHITDRLMAINRFYMYSKLLTKRVSNNLWQTDCRLSYKGVPGAAGTYDYYIGDSIKGHVPVLFDTDGFRTVPEPLNLKGDTIDLFLGCSFTFGDFIKAENGYPYLTAKMMGHSYIDAGGSGYGFGQMLQLAESLTLKEHFNYIFIQLSPWLSERAMFITSPTWNGYKPFPYFSDEGESFKINYPCFSTTEHSKTVWRNLPITYLDKIKFMLTDGLKTQLFDYYLYQWANLKVRFGMLPKPTERTQELEKYFYDKVIDICKKNKAIPVVVKVEYPDKDCKALVDYLKTKVQVIDLDDDLETAVKESGISYEKLKSAHHIQGKDTIIYDTHPNEWANSLFARRIVRDLKDQ